jgi:hypothetical protein
LPAGIADVIEPELEATTDEILATIAREVPDYARPLEGSFGRGVRTGVTEALRQFVELIRSPSGARGPGREVYVALGSGELRQGRTLDALQSAYRVGARVAWRRLAAAATREGFEPDVLSLLAESIFAYIETLSADSVEGYAEARARLEGESRRRRHELVAALLREPPAEEADLRAAAEAVAWRIPRTAAALACDEEGLDRLAMRLPADTLAAGLEGVGCAIVPDPTGRAGPARSSEPSRAAAWGRTPRWARPVPPTRSPPPGRWPAPRCGPSRPVRSRRRASFAPTMHSAGFSSSKTPASWSGSPRDGSIRSPTSRPRPAGAWSRRRSHMCSNGETPRPWRVRSACIRRRRATGFAGSASCSETHWTTRTLDSR